MSLYDSLPHDIFRIVCDYITVDQLEHWLEKINGGLDISRVPDYFRETLYVPYIIRNPSYFYYDTQTQELCEAVMVELSTLQYVHKQFKTRKFCFAMVEKFGGLALKYMSNLSKNKELCKFAFTKNVECLEFIPPKRRVRVIKDVSLSLNDIIPVFKHIPDDLKTQEMCDIAFSYDICNFTRVPCKYINQEMSTKFINEYPSEFMCIRNEFKTQDICDNAVKYKPFNFMNVPERCKTLELCDYAVKSNSSNFMYVPDKYKTQEMCDYAVKSHSSNFMYAPERCKTQEMCDYAVKSNSLCIEFVPDEFKTQEMCDYAVKSNSSNFMYVPDSCKTQEMCDHAVKSDSSNFMNVPDSCKTQELCDYAVKSNSLCIALVPDRFKTQELKNLLTLRF
jgi:hypothetical protein